MAFSFYHTAPERFGYLKAVVAEYHWSVLNIVTSLRSGTDDFGKKDFNIIDLMQQLGYANTHGKTLS